MAFVIKKAERKQVKIKIGVSSASGFGKTYSSLLLAKGLAGGDLSKVCVIDTENESASLYAHLGEYSTIDLEAPFTPERYMEAIKAVEDAGFEVCIIDSITHSWDGTGGFLEIHEQATKSMRSQNSFMAWSAVTPRYKKFIDSILQANIHIICCSRRKQEYEQVEQNGRKVVQKIGTKEINREGFEYELSVNFEIQNSEHYVAPSKDRTGLFPNNQSFVITEQTGAKILDWVNSGAPAQVKKPETPEDRINAMFKHLENQGISEARILAKFGLTEKSKFGFEEFKMIVLIVKNAEKYKTPLAVEFPEITQPEQSATTEPESPEQSQTQEPSECQEPQ